MYVKSNGECEFLQSFVLKSNLRWENIKYVLYKKLYLKVYTEFIGTGSAPVYLLQIHW